MKRCLCNCLSRLSLGLALCLSGCSISHSTLESNREFAVPEVGTAACAYDLPDVIEDRTSGRVVNPVGIGAGYSFTDNAVGTRTASR